MKKRLAAMEEEAQKLKDEANAIGDDMNTGDGASGAADAHIETSGSAELHNSFTGSHVLSSTQPLMFENLRHAA